MVPKTGNLRKGRDSENRAPKKITANRRTTLGAALNEGDIVATKSLKLPPSMRGCIIPEELFEQRKHPDVRIARRATTIVALARVISERSVSKGLRRTLITQAVRLQRLATERYKEASGVVPKVDPGEEV